PRSWVPSLPLNSCGPGYPQTSAQTIHYTDNPTKRPQHQPDRNSDDHEQRTNSDQACQCHAEVAKDGLVQTVGSEGLVDRRFKSLRRSVAGGRSQSDPGPGELASGEFRCLTGVIDKLVGVDQKRGEDPGRCKLFLVRQDLMREKRPAALAGLTQ